jgi:DNA gyrase subunit A
LVVDDSKLLLIAGRNGLGIRTKFSSFLPNGGKTSDPENPVKPRKRGGQGVTAMNTDAICGALSVCQDSEILMITSKGQAVRCPVLNIRETSRGSKGVKLVDLAKGDKLIGISEVIELDEESLETDEETPLSESSEVSDDSEPQSDTSDDPEPQSDASDDPAIE